MAQTKFQLPTVTSRRTYGAGTASARNVDKLGIDVSEMIEADVQHLLGLIAYDEIQGQVRLKNAPTNIFVDKRKGKNLFEAKRSVVITFGSAVQKIAIREVERILVSAIRKQTKKRTGRLREMSNWRWRMATESKGVGVQNKGAVNPYLLDVLAVNERLFLLPKSTISYASWANYKVTGRGTDFTPKSGKNKGVSRVENIGFMGLAVKQMRRNAKIKQAFRVRVDFTKKFDEGSDGYPHGSPCIVLAPRRTLLPPRRYQKRS